jgi:hypothetical protein
VLPNGRWLNATKFLCLQISVVKGWKILEFSCMVSLQFSEEKGRYSACQIGISDLTNELCSNPILHAKERYGNCRVGLQALVWVDGQDGWMVASFVVDSFLVCAPPNSTLALCELIMP